MPTLHKIATLDPFVFVPRPCIEDKTLSWRAKGILIYICSLTPGEIITFKQIDDLSTDPPALIKRAVKELVSYGVLTPAGPNRWEAR